jgi:hypothetical protein
MNHERMNHEAIRERLLGYRDLTDRVELSSQFLARLGREVPRRARLRRFVRDARAGLVVAALVGGGSRLWAHLDQEQLEREFSLQVGAWVEAP